MPASIAIERHPHPREIRFVTLTPFREANGVGIDEVNRVVRCIVITEGLGNLRDRNYYTADSIRSAVKVFESKQFYIDHPSESEEEDRPERSIRDLAGWFSDLKLGYLPDPETGEQLTACFANLHFDGSAAGTEAMAKVKEALIYQRRYPNSKDVYAGISINGGGVSHPGTIKEMQVNMVTEIQEAFSADIVTKPARGGRFLALVKEAARAAAWTRSRTQMRRETTRRSAAEGGRFMATAVDGKQQKAEVQRKALAEATTLLLSVNRLRRQVLQADAEDNLDGIKETAVPALKAAGVKFKKMKAASDAAGSELRDRLIDIQQDLGELGKLIGVGGGADEMPEEGEGGMAVPPSMAGDAEQQEGDGEGEDEQEQEGEGEAGGEKEKETNAAESNRIKSRKAREADDEQEAGKAEGAGEKETEGGEQETEGGEQEGDGEKEGETAEGFGDEDDDEDDDEGYGMGEDAEQDEDSDINGQRMEYKCGKCGETNEIAPPKGYRLSLASEAKMGESTRGLEGYVQKLQREIAMKEGRFVKTNHRLAKVLKENHRLKAKVMAADRMAEAAKKLKEANIPNDILPALDLVKLYDPSQWDAAIRNAKRMLEREQKLLGKAPLLRESGGSGAGAQDGGGDNMIAKFQESYNQGQGK